MAHARAKNISPLQMRRVVKFAVHHDLWCGNCFMVGRWRINGARTGEKYFARTSMVRRRVAGATIWGVAMFDGWVTGHRWRTDGRKIFRPYKCGAWLHWACATINGVAMVMVGRRRLNRAGTGEIFFARTHAARGYIGRAPRFMVWRW